MDLGKWQGLFYGSILSRGWNYFQDGSVRELSRSGNRIFATVIGSEEYEVSIELENGGVSFMDCTCPFAEGGENCKHMAAVLYAAQAADELPTPNAKMLLHKKAEPIERVEDENRAFRQALEEMPEDALRALVLELAQDDPKLRSRILSTQKRKLPESNLDELEYEIEELTRKAADRHGYIDYNHAYDYAWGLVGFLQETVPFILEGGEVMDAFRLTCYGFTTFAEQDMDDSDGGFQVVADACQELWNNQIEAASSAQREKMFAWFERTGTSPDFADDVLEAFRLTAFHDRVFLKKNLAMLDAKIARLEGAKDSFSEDYHLTNCVIRRLRVMEELGASQDEINSFREPYLHLHGVRETLLQEYADQGRNEEAIDLLLKSCELDGDSPGYVGQHKLRLLEFYEKTGEQDLWKAAMEDVLLNSRQYCLDHVHEFKNKLSPEDWQKFLPRLLDAGTLSGCLLDLLAEEEMYDRMMTELEKSASLDSILKYAALLQPRFPERLTACFAHNLQLQMNRAYDPKGYRRAVEYLTNLQRLPGGRAAAKAMAEKWRSEHPRRRSMLEALDKIGL